MGRPEPAGDEQQLALETLAECLLELLERVPDDCDPRGLETARYELAREKRAVLVTAIAADQLAARDDDG